MQVNDQNRFAYGTGVARPQAEIDQGLRAFMLGVYNYMVLGLGVTGVVALGAFMTARGSEAVFNLLYVSPLKWVIMLAPLAFVFLFSFRIEKMSVSGAQGMFLAFAALMGLSMSTIFFVFTGESIVQVFFVTAAAFAGLSLWGYTTKKSLSGMGSFLIMGVIGLLIAMVVNIFLGSGTLAFVISVLGVLIFAGLTAWDTQRLKEMYLFNDFDQATASKVSIMGALSLYLNFINMFQFLLHLLGNRE